jgi:hypothetical protein
MPSLYKDLDRAGIPTDHYESDLYVLDTLTSRALVNKYGYKFKSFTSDGRRWLDVPFAYEPFWKKKEQARQGAPSGKRNVRAATAPKRRSHSTMQTDQLHEAQLYWDDQDPKNQGWWLRYRDERGEQQGTTIEADEDAATEELAAAVEAGVHRLPGNGKIKVFRGEEPRGSITLIDGKVSNWRAHSTMKTESSPRNSFRGLRTYKISNSNGLSGPVWDADYTTQDRAAEAIRRAYRWDEVVLSDSYSVGDDYGTGDASAVSAYQTQQDCDADPDGAHAPRIVEIVRRGLRQEV